MDNILLPPVPRAELTSLIRRLEAATSRLEDIATSTVEIPKPNGAAPTPAPTGPLPPAPVPPRAADPPKQLSPLLPQPVEEFDEFIDGPLGKFVNLSDELGGPVSEQVCDKDRTLCIIWADEQLGFERLAGLRGAAKIYPHHDKGKEA